MQPYNSRKAFYQLRAHKPKIAKLNHELIMTRLEEVTDTVIAEFLTRKKRASSLYLGEIAEHRGIVLKVDYHGRINAEWVEGIRLNKLYSKDNNIFAVAA